MDKCRYCPAPRHRHPSSVTCGSLECKRVHNRERCREQQQRLRVEYRARGENYTARWRPLNAKKCAGCGGPVKAGKRERPLCRACSRIDYQLRKIEEATVKREREASAHNSRPARAIRKLEVAASGSAGRWRHVSGRCQDCGEWFVVKLAGLETRYCSRTCSRRAGKGRRRALQAGCEVTPGRRYKIYERDEWVCRICGDPVNREANVPELDAPVIDHIVPLATGGPHAPENWQTAHFYCNSVKRDLVDFDGGVAA